MMYVFEKKIAVFNCYCCKNHLRFNETKLHLLWEQLATFAQFQIKCNKHIAFMICFCNAKLQVKLLQCIKNSKDYLLSKCEEKRGNVIDQYVGTYITYANGFPYVY